MVSKLKRGTPAKPVKHVATDTRREPADTPSWEVVRQISSGLQNPDRAHQQAKT
jgi:hypothetical protein